MQELLIKTFDTDYWLELAPTLISVFVTTVLFIIFYIAIARALRKALSKTSMAGALSEILVSSIFKWVVIIFAIISILNQFGVDVTAALAGLGIAGIALGFAAKESLANILSGFAIFMDKLYVTGDWVEIVGNYGQVKKITLRTTKIRTLDNIFIIIPNSQITQNPVTNYSEEGMVRITAKIGIGYGESIDKAREVLVTAATNMDGVRIEPAPAVVVDELGDSSINLLVRMWVDEAGTDPFYRYKLTEVCKKALDEAGIEIPFPQRVVHTKS